MLKLGFGYTCIYITMSVCLNYHLYVCSYVSHPHILSIISSVVLWDIYYWKLLNNTEMFPLFSVEPIFDKVSPTKIEIIEDESRTVDMTARANPTDVTYTLYKQGEITQVSSFTINNGMLQISGIKRDHSGQYALKAANSEGFRFHNFSVNVLCKWKIMGYFRM